MRRTFTILFSFILLAFVSTKCSAQSNKSFQKDSTLFESKIKKALDEQYQNPQLSLQLALQADSIAQSTNCKSCLARVNSLIGKIYKSQGEFQLALEHQIKCLKINEELKDYKSLMISHNDIGVLYKNINRFDLALTYFRKALSYSDKVTYEEAVTNIILNIGTIHNALGNLDSALFYYQRSLDKAYKKNNFKAIANALNNIGEIYARKNDHKNALVYFKKTLEVDRQTDNKYGIVYSYLNIGNVEKDLGRYDQALINFNQALSIAKEMDAKPLINNAYQSLSDLYRLKNDYQKAFEYHHLYTSLKDSLFNEESSRQVTEMETKYSSEKKDQEIKLLSKDKQIQNEELKRQKLFIYFGLATVVLLLGLFFFIYRGYKLKKKANEALSEAYTQIEEKNKDITDSINYAKRIQQAILPTAESIIKHIPEICIYYRPKDIVSGDFYFFSEIPDDPSGFIIAAADCTGHGVPGAFMSMIGNQVLNQIIIERKIKRPSEILSQLHEGIRIALKQNQSTTETKDGMDIALCYYQPVSRRLEFAGALRNLYIVRNSTQEVEEVKADKQSIGGVKSEVHKIFTNHSIQLEKNDCFYLFSDGYADQFGGPEGKKFMTKKFKQMLLGIQNKNMSQQELELEKEFLTWKGNIEQVDDILVIGIRS